MKGKVKKIIAAILAVAMSAGTAAGMVCTDKNLLAVHAAVTQCTTYNGSNEGAQSYKFNFSAVINSYLEPISADGMMRVQANAADEAYLVEYYDNAYNIQDTKLIPEELDIFGGFYATDSNYYIVSGQSNPEELAEVECFRITKYDKDWNRISHAGLFDCNTTIPFEAGSLRFAESGKYLLIRTSHEMYQSEDGRNHQANVTIQLDTETMTITDSCTEIRNRTYGYVSHSFNQFIHVEDNQIVAVDHGDANPRSIALIRYNTDMSEGKFVPSNNDYCDVIELLKFQGEKGDNTTGATVGGFEVSDTSYLVAYNSIDQENGALYDETKNIYIAACDKETLEVTIRQVTDFAEGEATLSTPHFVKISDTDFLLMWSIDDDVFCVKVDHQGQLAGEVQKISGVRLSDCVPMVHNNRLIWYVWNQNVNTFYEIDLTDLSKYEVVEIVNGHDLEVLSYPSNGSNICNIKCKNCDYTEQIKAPLEYMIFWNDDGGPSYLSGLLSNRKKVGDVLYFWLPSFDEEAENTEMTIRILESEPGIVEMDFNAAKQKGTFTFLKDGQVTITFAPKYNPALEQTYVITVGDWVPVDPTPDQTNEVCKIFPDVKHEEWYESGVQFVYDRSIMTGTNGLFLPNDKVTRKQIVTILYRMEGSPKVTDKCAIDLFPDVSEDAYYANAVCWAYNEKVTTGTNGLFKPDELLTREQMAAFLFRYAALKGYDVSVRGNYKQMLNWQQLHSYGEEPMSWAVGAGLISGSAVKDSNGKIYAYDLKPLAYTTRAQVATIIMRFCETYN